jgi:hypothetical protein
MTVKISELPAATAAAATDQFPSNQSGTTRRVTAAQIGDYVRGLAGTVRQVVRAVPGTTNGTTTTGTYVDYGVNLDITPASVSNRILLFGSFTGAAAATAANTFAQFAIRTGSTEVLMRQIYLEATGATAIDTLQTIALIGEHSPSTTSAVNYKISLLAATGTTATVVASAAEKAELIALEIVA